MKKPIPDKISLPQLRDSINKLLDHIEFTHALNEVEIHQPYYWQIKEDQLFDLECSKNDLDIEVGSLIDDWEFLSCLQEVDAQPIVYQLCEVAPILNYIGMVLSKKLASEGG